MKVLVIGASGKTGRLVVEELLAQHHEVTGFVRSTMHVEEKERLGYVQGEARSRESFDRAIQGKNAVISTFSTIELEPHGVFEAFMKNLTGAMKDAGVARLVSLARGSAGVRWKDLSLVVRAASLGMGREMTEDAANAVEVLHASELDFVDVRPTKLGDAAATGQLRATADEKSLDWKREVSRADVAAFAVDMLASDAWVKKRVYVGYERS